MTRSGRGGKSKTREATGGEQARRKTGGEVVLGSAESGKPSKQKGTSEVANPKSGGAINPERLWGGRGKLKHRKKPKS